MKKLVAVLGVSAAVLVSSTAKAFTLYTANAPQAAGTITCSIINVGPIPLEVQVIPYRGSEPSGPIEWGGMSPRVGFWSVTTGQSTRCVFKVKAKDPRRTATTSMVRAAAQFSEGWSFEAR